jgi:hypothetical protein
MKRLQSLHSAIERVADKTIDDFAEELSVLESALALYIEGLESIPPFPAEKEDLLVRMALLSHNLNTLVAALDVAVRGFHTQSILMLRNVYENWLAFWYLAENPQEAHYWLESRWDCRPPPKVVTMKNKMKHPTKTAKSKLACVYDELTRFAHSNPTAVLSRLNPGDNNDKLVIGIGVRYRREEFAACSYGLSLWIGSMLDAVSAFHASSDSWQKEYDEMLSRLLEIIRRHNAAYPVPPDSCGQE